MLIRRRRIIVIISPSRTWKRDVYVSDGERSRWGGGGGGGGGGGTPEVGFYTILPSPIWYGVWHKKGGSVGGRILCNERAIALQ